MVAFKNKVQKSSQVLSRILKKKYFIVYILIRVTANNKNCDFLSFHFVSTCWGLTVYEL